MNTTKGKKREDFSMAIAPNDGHKLSKEEKDLIKEDAKVRHAKRSPECLVRNEMLSVLYRVEEYLQQENLKAEEIYTIEYFVGEFCKVLGLNKSQFANYLDTDISNLNKYLKGQRAFNIELAMKFSRFFHTPVDVWLKVQLKNDLIALHEAEKGHKYDKYDYKKVLKMA
ncbi:plasmid maintenance system antidote protein VapI [Pedobacter cryoconitis]|uniref:Plasmid maintenance system antidote protein VapI n=1 Tax=Pedobacter cryoconitis TaxID=188932 RepID=A0A7W8YRT6_9SPHI|nr:transcriptional regulator [Pedobacter cryoconitis]MBB5620492.1 plasmid maintenance system antidote protein VapI [Pedobacter cryoconitis]MBB5646436.1 plasmid maintenance system antidote protein VapI [Pedobacter cryoconitis]